VSRSQRTLAGGGLVLLLVTSLLATVPARVLGWLLPAEQISMQGFSGTVWNGEASRCLVKTPAGYLHLGVVSWRLQPLSLLLFAPHISLKSVWGGQTLDAELIWRGADELELRELEANIPAGLLRQFVPVSLAGLFSVQLGHLHLRDGVPVEGNGRLVWQQGAWDAPGGPVGLGSYALDFSQQSGAALIGDVITLSGPVDAEGVVQLQDRTYNIDISVQSPGGLDPRLQQALSLMAKPVGRGYRMQLDGDL
jgi:hypothetical protein